jgi:SAM-dependent methyltransferase
MTAIWHDLECGSYTEDLLFWLALAQRCGNPVLDIGAGTGRTALALARAGFTVTAIDVDDELLEQLRERGTGLNITTLVADARSFWLGGRFALCIVPMQTVQLLGGAAARAGFLACARDHLEPGGRLAIAIAEELECFEVPPGVPGPLPDVREIDGVVYRSLPTAVRPDGDSWLLERRREIVAPGGEVSAVQDLIRLDRLDAATLEQEAIAVGLRPTGRLSIPATDEFVGSTVVVFGG